MQVRQMNDIVDAVLDHLGIYRPGGEDVSGHEALHLLLGPDPKIELHESEPQVALDSLIETLYICLIAWARRVLKQLNVRDACKAHAVESPQRVGVVADVLDTFGDVGIFEDRLESLAALGRYGEGRLAENEDVDESNYPLWVDENSDDRDRPMSAERISFEI
jgi:hypothetical protein